ncbi:hypothetical protein Cgig2_026113 [Carnegiea gigantea]|uniref:Protein kinase domain-containing protein n=1 Tax=Carnegiea gigantea TaxID=171969 RepID=A0A9Q1GRM3_9CARY|nr:hypothetical protein Cgig2_026113 [Carnegiea gigantea]
METSLHTMDSSCNAATNHWGNNSHFHDSPSYAHNHDNLHHGTLSLTSILLIVIPIILVILLASVIILIILLRRQKSAKCNSLSRNSTNIDDSSKFDSHTTINFTGSPEVKNGCIAGGSSRRTSQCRFRGVQVFTYKEREMATNNFSEANVVGHGAYGVVYRGVLSDGTVAAIKMVLRDGKQGERAFRIEVDLLSRLNSPCLVELLGYFADQDHRLLIFEFIPNGSLQQHLHSPHIYPQPLDWGTRLRIALGCARVLEFLHEHMVSNNINGQISTRVLGTTEYLAPEYVSTGKLTTKSDVYSFGVVLLQLITGGVPVDTRRPPGEHVLVSWVSNN